MIIRPSAARSAIVPSAGWSLAITDELLVADLTRVAPTAASVLSARGVPAGETGHSLADVARRHALALDELLDELRESAAGHDARATQFACPGA